LKHWLSFLSALSVLVCLLVGAGSTQAKVTGKISGIVVDAGTEEPLVGASVRVVGTSLATKTDEDGEYFIINVPAGKYDLAVTHVGFETFTKKDVRVLLDLTTPVDFSMTVMAVELPNEVVVYAAAPVIQKDLTSSRVIFTEERLKSLPNITSVQTILTNYPGVVLDRDQNLHIRGGRSGQVSYYFDGFNVQDPFTHASGIRIVPASLAELSLTSGGFTAEYGEALSGVVSAVTREGGARYHGSARAYQGATHQYDLSNASWGDFSKADNRALNLDFSGPIPGMDPNRNTFYAAGEYLRDDGYLPHNWSTSNTGLAKLSTQPLGKLSLKGNVTYNESDGGVYYHRDVNNVSYDFNLDGLPVLKRKAYLAGVSGNYMFSERSVLSVTLNRFMTRTRSGPAHLLETHWSQWPGYSEDENGEYNGSIQTNNYGNTIDYSDPAQVVGFTAGTDFDPTYAYRQSSYNALSATVVNQANNSNQLKAGFEFRRYSVDWDFKQFYNTHPYGELYSSKPTYASMFVEDKLEYETFVVNLGLRYDYRDADISYNYTPEDTLATYKKAESNARVSPRLGVSFPITEKSVIHFNYGTYYQVPEYSYLYTNLQGETKSGYPMFGNPDLKPEETVAYELGLDHMIGSSMRIDATAYYKDISDLVTTRRRGFGRGGSPLTRYVNEDYGSVTGIDVGLEYSPASGYLTGSLSYGYQVAKGIGSNADEPYYTYITSSTDTLAPVTEYPLDFDQRHTITTVLELKIPREWSGHLLGMKLPSAWGLSLVGYYGSGLPYTKTDENGNRLGERNQERLPANYTVDMRFDKDFLLGAVGRALTFFVEVDNLFNRLNVLDVYTRTGEPDDDGVLNGRNLSLDANELDKFDNLFDHDPLNYSPPRTVRTGLEFSF
jgi:outer membrane receptor protein involved in Fe transport